MSSSSTVPPVGPVVGWVLGAAVLFGFLFIGEIVTELLHLRVPASVIGMVLLVISCSTPIGSRLAAIVSRAGDSLLALMPLLLIPLAVGVLDEADILAADGPAAFIALASGWLVATLVAAGITVAAFKRGPRR